MRDVTTRVFRMGKTKASHVRMMTTFVLKEHACGKKNVLESLNNEGYAYIQPSFYEEALPKTQVKKELKKIQSTYGELKKDFAPVGNRYRAYTRFKFNVEADSFEEDTANGYQQSETYDPAFGNQVRQYEKICVNFLDNPVISNLVKMDIEIAKASGLVNFDDSLELGLHQIRYFATPHNPSFSSPMGLHRDDEPVVFVHLFNVSKNMVGGTNLLAPNNGNAKEVVHLQKPLESLLLSKKLLHSVMPIGTKDESPAFRDILLVTFFNRKKPSQSAPVIEAKNHVKDTSVVANKM